MPYIVIKSNGQEIDRRELTGGLVIGRAADCDVTVHDILLSRRHCRLEPGDEGWMLIDLQSKNGTAINGERLSSTWVLKDNDVVRLGRSKIIFHACVPDEDIADRLLTPARPADPGDSLSGTLSGFTLLLPGESETPENMPCPQPRPKDPPAYGQEELQALLSGIASSSWDSVYAEARQPIRREQGITEEDDGQARRRVRPRTPMDFSLQVNPASPAATAIEEPPPRQRRRQAIGLQPRLQLAVAAVWIAAILLLNVNRRPLASGSTPDHPTPPMASLAAALPDNPTPQPTVVSAANIIRLDDISPAVPTDAKPPRTLKFRFDKPAIEAGLKTAALYFPLVYW